MKKLFFLSIQNLLNSQSFYTIFFNFHKKIRFFPSKNIHEIRKNSHEPFPELKSHILRFTSNFPSRHISVDLSAFNAMKTIRFRYRIFNFSNFHMSYFMFVQCSSLQSRAVRYEVNTCRWNFWKIKGFSWSEIRSLPLPEIRAMKKFVFSATVLFVVKVYRIRLYDFKILLIF